jgi:hypothetical protein
MESNFNKDFLMKVSMVIPCAHIPRDLIADRAIKSFVSYLDNSLNEGKTLNQVLFDITAEEKYNV